MHDAHITVELLKQILLQTVSPSELVRRISGHLCSICPECAAALEQFNELAAGLASREEDEQGILGGVGDAPLSLEERLARLRQPIVVEQEDARQKSERLVGLTDEQARAGIEDGEYRGAALADELLTYVHRCLPGRPEDALRFAELALLVLKHTPESPYAIDVRVRATAHIGNALRNRGALKEAQYLVETARWIMNHAELADPLTAAELDWIEGTLRRDQRRFDEALPLLQRATVAYQEYSDSLTAYRSALSLGCLYQDMGDYHRAAEIPLVIFAAEVPAQIRIVALQNLAHAWLEGGHAEQAAALLDEADALLRKVDQLTQIRCTWIRGKIARALKDWQVAESHLRAAAHGMRRHERPYDVALVHLDLSAVLLATGRAAEVRELAEELVTVFDGLGTHREAITALTLYRDAVALDQISETDIAKLASFLRAAAVEPGLAWRAPA